MPKNRTPTEDYERRKQERLHKLGTNDPHCSCCSESDWRAIQQHHMAGEKHDDLTINICANDHLRLTDSQNDHPKTKPNADELLAKIGNFLLGLADLFELIFERLREFGEALIARANEAALKPEGRK
jgi:hypothetical protein